MTVLSWVGRYLAREDIARLQAQVAELQRLAALDGRRYQELAERRQKARAHKTRQKNARIKRLRESRDTWKKKAKGFEDEAERLRGELKERR